MKGGWQSPMLMAVRQSFFAEKIRCANFGIALEFLVLCLEFVG